LSWRPRFRIIDTADLAPDPSIAAQVQAYQAFLSKELDVPLGKITIGMDSSKAIVRTREAAIGNLITDAMRDRTGADVALVNGGGIRGNRHYVAGSSLTRRDVLIELPFGNKIHVVEMTGAQLLKALENGLWFAGKPNGRFIQISGARIHADRNAVPGQRIKTVVVGSEPLDTTRNYRVATNTFIASGKEGYDIFRQAKIFRGETDGPLLANTVMAYIRKTVNIAPRVEGRVVID
jgi:2',3'-cyclic-nucleotide 2'-phosphodiesterase (5'-nucleotidase family)